MGVKNKKWVLRERPQGLVKDSDFELVTEDLPKIKEGEILLENIYLSFDPTQRGWLNDVPGYLPPVQIGEVVRSGGIGRVLESKNAEYKVDDLTFGFVGWQTHCVTKPEADERFRVVPDLLPIPTMLNVMGSTGITAYYGLIELGDPKPGEPGLVSGAAGATGSVVVDGIVGIHRTVHAQHLQRLGRGLRENPQSHQGLCDRDPYFLRKGA